MKKLIEKVKSLTSVIKIVFFISVLVLIIVEMIHLKRTISVEQLKSVFGQLSPMNLFLIILVGVIAVLPTTGYDFVLNGLLRTDKSKRYILQTSWCINTFNNLSGFGGLIDIGLRMAFYGKKGQEKSDLIEVTRFLPYLISGLSFISVIALIMSHIFHAKASVDYYYLVLIGASMYFPVIYWISGHKGSHYFGDMPSSTRIKLGIVSFFEWGCAAAAFIIIGYLMGIHLPVYKILPLFCIGCAVGIVSLIPGGLGSFELVLFTGFAAEGLPKETVVAWLLLYRLAYYIIPFFAGIYFFIHYLGSQINQRYENVPKELVSTVLQTMVSHLMRILGAFLIFSTAFFENITYIMWLQKLGLDPLQEQMLWQFPGLLLGVCFILLARTIDQKVKNAFPIAIIWITLTLFYLNLGHISWRLSFWFILLLLGLLVIKPTLYKKQFIYSWEERIKDGIIIVSLMGVLFYIAGLLFPIRAHITGGSIERLHYIIAWEPIALATLILTLVYLCLVKILQGKSCQIGDVFNVDRYKKLLQAYGGSSDSGLAFLNDKRLYWYQKNGEDCVAFQFVIVNNKCLIMGEPAGDDTYIREAIESFIDDADKLDYDLVFYSIGQKLTLLLHEYGFDFMKVGEDALVNLETFTLKGNKYKPFRNALNRVEKDGFYFEVVQSPHSQELLNSLEEISNTWLEGRPEKGFSLGYFNKDYFQQAPIALVKNAEHEVVAFANIMPNYEKSIISIDLMRHDKQKIPNGVMDFLFLSLFSYYQEKGYHYFDLGMAPLSGVGRVETSFAKERMAYLVYHFGSHFYSFNGLHKYKKKFTPLWSERYISCSRSSWLICAICALLMEDSKIKIVK
ncbi:TPA: bifunctional lysylphosphatidylglycerol flippase/synthetase MprF [Streptococcus agalactiae]|nr:bifunctional lysylphosphatidylglycerol flippase/synthetase MprF [Streptococcus agalactiae]HEO0132793.1 bifunctional lysylphosphatidylglycerol flippase/synthetase MprF [Streptococcus agalactiae]HEO6139309.1 bifunctional lysylphosphatidylglycerol flippase/synthetase MprF [Streptococcus agalactiae]